MIALEVEKMDFEDAGTYEVTDGDIDVDVTILMAKHAAALYCSKRFFNRGIKGFKISGLELYLDRTLPVGGYALKNVEADNILWENSHSEEDDRADQDTYYEGNKFDYEKVGSMVDDKDAENKVAYDFNGIFKYKAVVGNDSYVEVVTQARDQDDSTTNRKIVITIGATTMAVGTETITLDTPAYINAENYTELPLRAVSEAFGATVNWEMLQEQ